LAGGLKELQGSKETRQKLRQARDLFYAVFDANPIPTVLTRQEDELFLPANAEFPNALSQTLHDDLQPPIFAGQVQLSFLRDDHEKNELNSFPVNFDQLDE
jgi:hypothetical protein